MARRQLYQNWGQLGRSSSGGPSPPTTACRVTSPVVTVRLVKVSVNPAGRPGTSVTVNAMVVSPRDAKRRPIETDDLSTST